jgi:hypothetical protein
MTLRRDSSLEVVFVSALEYLSNIEIVTREASDGLRGAKVEGEKTYKFVTRLSPGIFVR